MMLATLVVLELLLALYLWMPKQRAALSPGIEERHYITLTVRDPEGRVISKTYETRSFVYTHVLALRMLSTWYSPGTVSYATRLSVGIAMNVLNTSGYYSGTWSGPSLYDDNIHFTPSLVFLGSGASADGGATLGSPLGVSSAPSVGYIYNDVWFNVTVTATFSFSQAATVSEAMLAALVGDGGSGYVSIVYDSFPAVSVPAGGSLTVQWTFAWKDYGAFTENWGKLWQYALTLNYGSSNPDQYVNFIDDTGATVSIPWPNAYDGSTVALRLAWGTGTSPMSRTSYRLELETGSVQVGYSVVGTGFSVGAAVGGRATEVGLYWLAVDASGVAHRILLMRWVPGYELPAGTPINVYVARGG